MSNRVIDNFETIDGWISSDPLKISVSKNDWPSLTYDKYSLRADIKQESKDVYFEKTYEQSWESDQEPDLRFLIYRYSTYVTRNLNISDFALKVGVFEKIADKYHPIQEWYVPMERGKIFQVINLDIKGLQQFNTIRFTVLNDDPEIYFITNLNLCKDEPVVDALVTLLGELDGKISLPLGKLKQAVSSGDKSIFLDSWENVVRHSKIKISEGSTSEEHQVEGVLVDTGELTFQNKLDSSDIKNDFTENADVSLVIPAQILSKDMDYYEPSLGLDGFLMNLMDMTDGKLYFDSYRTGGQVRVLRENRKVEMPISIHAVCATPELMAFMNSFIQEKFGENYVLQINCYQYDVLYGKPEFEEGNVEDQTDRTSHSLTIYLEAPFKSNRGYFQFPLNRALALAVTPTTELK